VTLPRVLPPRLSPRSTLPPPRGSVWPRGVAGDGGVRPVESEAPIHIPSDEIAAAMGAAPSPEGTTRLPCPPPCCPHPWTPSPSPQCVMIPPPRFPFGRTPGGTGGTTGGVSGIGAGSGNAYVRGRWREGPSRNAAQASERGRGGVPSGPSSYRHQPASGRGPRRWLDAGAAVKGSARASRPGTGSCSADRAGPGGTSDTTRIIDVASFTLIFETRQGGKYYIHFTKKIFLNIKCIKCINVLMY